MKDKTLAYIIHTSTYIGSTIGFQQQLKQHSGMLFMNPMVTYFFDLRIMSIDMTDWILTQLESSL